VVLLWNLQDTDRPASTGDLSIGSLDESGQAAATAVIAGPRGAVTLAQDSERAPLDDAPIIDLPRLRPNALPRPPEQSQPIQPSSFVRFTAQHGDTIYDRSTVYGVSIDDILRFNPTLGDGTQISIGQLIFVPGS